MPKNPNVSYDNCISKLQSKYEDRGVKASAQNEAKVQIKREMSAPNAYFVARMNKSSIENYRNGELNGQKYMTTGDFLKYYNNRKVSYPMQNVMIPKSEVAKTKEFKTTPQASEQRIESATHTAAPQAQRPVARKAKTDKYDPNARTIELPSVTEQKGVRAKVGKFINKWFPKEDKKENTTTFKRNVPVATIGLIISSTIAMTMIIGSTVMASQANVAVSDLKYEIAALKKEEVQLEEKLTRKENLDEIKAYATENLGMISKDYVAAEYISLSSDDDTIVRYSDVQEENLDFSTLLSAIFGE